MIDPRNVDVAMDDDIGSIEDWVVLIGHNFEFDFCKRMAYKCYD